MCEYTTTESEFAFTQLQHTCTESMRRNVFACSMPLLAINLLLCDYGA